MGRKDVVGPQGGLGEAVAWTSLVDRCRGGDASAWDELVGRLHPEVVAVSRSVLGEEGLARDAAQEAWLRIWRHLGTYREGSLLGWVRTIAARTAVDRLRSRRRERTWEGTVENLEGTGIPAPSGPAQTAEARSKVREVLASLPSAQREVLVLRDMEGMTPTQIAQGAGCSPERIRGILFRAREKFRQEWVRRCGEEG